MAKNSFDYAYTCPKIDRAISQAEKAIQDYIEGIINDLCPYIPDDKVRDLSSSWGGELYNQISDCFESVRETNEDMRKCAEEQIEALFDDIDSLERQVNELKYQLT